MKRRRFLGGLGATFLAPPVFAIDYLSFDEARALLFPGATAFVPMTLDGAASRLAQPVPRPRLARLRAYDVRANEARAGYVVADAVIGKFEYIDYAVALAPDFTIRQVEILAYRESHGHEIRQSAWRAQFQGKGPADSLRLNDDIRNVSGATLSCSHVTDGVRTIVALVREAATR